MNFRYFSRILFSKIRGTCLDHWSDKREKFDGSSKPSSYHMVNPVQGAIELRVSFSL